MGSSGGGPKRVECPETPTDQCPETPTETPTEFKRSNPETPTEFKRSKGSTTLIGILNCILLDIICNSSQCNDMDFLFELWYDLFKMSPIKLFFFFFEYSVYQCSSFEYTVFFTKII